MANLMEPDLMPEAQCPICKESNHTVLDVVVRHAEDLCVNVCESCELTYLWPQPDDERLKVFYETEYRDVYEDPTPAECYLDAIPEAELRLKRIMPLLSKDSQLLEVGSGSFAFLKNVEPHVDTAIGVEPDQKIRDWFSTVSDIKAVSNIDELTEADGEFDLIVLFHVLEHVADPIAFLNRLSLRLRPGGRVVIEVPNIDDALLSLYKVKAFEDFYYSFAHLTYFSSKTLTRCAEEAGLSGDVTGVQRYDLSNHIHWTLQKIPGGQAVYSSIISPETNASYAQDLVDTGKADTLWGVFALKA